MIRWITDRLGTSSWDFAHALPGIHIVDVRDLVDKRGNTVDSLKPKIADAVAALKQGEKVVICCDYGISRSNSIAAGVLAIYEKIPINDAIQQVCVSTGERGVKLDVLETVRQAIGIQTSSSSVSSILVTGASGFIGSSITKRLLEDKRVVVAPSHQDIDLLYDVVKLDLIVKQHNAQKIVHLASPHVYTTNASLGSALVMLKNILDVAVQNHSKLYYLSSWEIYSGYKTQKLLADESLPPCPGSTYGQSKHLSEILIHQCAQRYGLDYLIIRSSPVYGLQSDRPKFIWNFLSKARQNQDIVTHQYLNGYPALDLLHITDLQTVVFAAIEADITGELNIGSGEGITTTDVARMLIEKTGSQSKLMHTLINDYVGNIVMDYTRAKLLLDWQPTITVSQGLDQYVQI